MLQAEIERAKLRQEMGNRLREMRKTTGISRDELAESLDIKNSHLGLIERGERGITTYMITKICAYFKCSADYLLTGKDNLQKISPHAREIDDSLDDEAKKQLCRFIRACNRPRL